MITVRRDAVRTQGRAPKGGGDQRDHEAVGSSSQLEARFQSRRGCQMQHSCRNAKVVPASTVVTGRNSSVLKVSLAARQCQRLRSTKVSIRSRSSACSRLVSTERPHRNLTVRRIAGRRGDRRREFITKWAKVVKFSGAKLD